MHVLIVDDSKTIRFMLLRLLTELGYKSIAQAVDTEDALQQIERQVPDLILSDYNMPGKNGVEFLKIVRKNPATSQTPFVMITTIHDKKVICDAVRAGLQHYIFKPIEKTLLIEKLMALSVSHHIQPPVAAVGARVIDSSKIEDSAPLKAAEPADGKQAMFQEQVKNIVEHFFLVVDGEMTVQDFHAWAGANVLPCFLEECKIKSSQELLDLIRSGAESGIQSVLQKRSA